VQSAAKIWATLSAARRAAKIKIIAISNPVYRCLQQCDDGKECGPPIHFFVVECGVASFDILPPARGSYCSSEGKDTCLTFWSVRDTQAFAAMTLMTPFLDCWRFHVHRHKVNDSLCEGMII